MGPLCQLEKLPAAFQESSAGAWLEPEDVSVVRKDAPFSRLMGCTGLAGIGAWLTFTLHCAFSGLLLHGACCLSTPGSSS